MRSPGPVLGIKNRVKWSHFLFFNKKTDSSGVFETVMTARFKPEEGHGRFVAKNLSQGI